MRMGLFWLVLLWVIVAVGGNQTQTHKAFCNLINRKSSVTLKSITWLPKVNSSVLLLIGTHLFELNFTSAYNAVPKTVHNFTTLPFLVNPEYQFLYVVQMENIYILKAYGNQNVSIQQVDFNLKVIKDCHQFPISLSGYSLALNRDGSSGLVLQVAQNSFLKSSLFTGMSLLAFKNNTQEKQYAIESTSNKQHVLFRYTTDSWYNPDEQIFQQAPAGILYDRLLYLFDTKQKRVLMFDYNLIAKSILLNKSFEIKYESRTFDCFFSCQSSDFDQMKTKLIRKVRKAKSSVTEASKKEKKVKSATSKVNPAIAKVKSAITKVIHGGHSSVAKAPAPTPMHVEPQFDADFNSQSKHFLIALVLGLTGLAFVFIACFIQSQKSFDKSQGEDKIENVLKAKIPMAEITNYVVPTVSSISSKSSTTSAKSTKSVKGKSKPKSKSHSSDSKTGSKNKSKKRPKSASKLSSKKLKSTDDSTTSDTTTTFDSTSCSKHNNNNNSLKESPLTKPKSCSKHVQSYIQLPQVYQQPESSQAASKQPPKSSSASNNKPKPKSCSKHASNTQLVGEYPKQKKKKLSQEARHALPKSVSNDPKPNSCTKHGSTIQMPDSYPKQKHKELSHKAHIKLPTHKASKPLSASNKPKPTSKHPSSKPTKKNSHKAPKSRSASKPKPKPKSHNKSSIQMPVAYSNSEEVAKKKSTTGKPRSVKKPKADAITLPEVLAAGQEIFEIETKQMDQKTENASSSIPSNAETSKSTSQKARKTTKRVSTKSQSKVTRKVRKTTKGASTKLQPKAARKARKPPKAHSSNPVEATKNKISRVDSAALAKRPEQTNQ